MIRTIFLDMDDVCNRFMEYALEWLECPREDIHSLSFAKLNVPYSKDVIWSKLNYDFWRTIPESEEFERLWNWCVNWVGWENVVILTGLPPLNICDCIGGKLEWLRNHIGIDCNFLIGNCKSVCAQPNSLLIDDSEINCQKFNEASGPTILVPRPWNYNRGSNLDKLCAQFDPWNGRYKIP